ncbi:hypothetical protein AOQ84DRAFT_82363 [Glonium stellatum]|uniref:Ribonuclease H2 subunit B n=1 Tax=Glonium stellatum TaxID=574774 RepID=A0A8E2EWH0_9PEZI|nr:hypothetical protein AOQ84DRAFT_82363 [Glonium stellatum]
MARTRSKPAIKDPVPASTSAATAALPPSALDPPKLFILPTGASPAARIVTLPNPVTASPTRYFFCPKTGFYEFTKIAAPKKVSRSWLLAPHKAAEDRLHKITNSPEEVSQQGAGNSDKHDSAENIIDTPLISKGYITKSADLFVATPLDLMFLILPALSPISSVSKESQKQLFLSLDDYLDALSASSPHLKQLLLNSKLQDKISRRMAAICDIVDAGDEKMYRLSQRKLLAALLSKAERMAKEGLPTSMEEKFVRSVLEIPIMSVRREESELGSAPQTGPIPVGEGEEATEDKSQSATQSFGTATPVTTTGDSQSPITSSSTVSSLVTPTLPEVALSKPPSTAPEGILHLLRIRTILTFIFSSYIPPHLHKQLQALLQDTKSPDFAPLDAHLSHIASMHSQVQALRSLSDNISRKRGFEGDDEAAEARAEKKRMKEEEEKRKKNESKAVKQLKKVDTTGMKKLSAFFVKVGSKK